MAQCAGTASTPGRPNFGNQCGRNAVHGSSFCEAHGGVQDTSTPDAVLKNPFPAGQCRSKKRNGEPCSKKAIKGGVVCRSHGGHLPAVKAKAQQRMLELVIPALEELRGILLDPSTADPDRLRAIALLLDRTGFGPKAEVVVETKPYERIMSTIYRQVPEGMRVDTYEQGRAIEQEDGEDDPDGYLPREPTVPEPGEGVPVPETPVQRGNLTLVVGSAEPPKRPR